MIESLRKTHADLHRACRKRDVEKSAKVAERLSVMLAQEIVSAFGTVTVLDIPTILAACELATSFILDTANDAGLTEPETATEAEPETVLQSTASVRYALTAAERDEVERVVMAEAGAEPYVGQMAVAQCILNACEQENERPAEIVRRYGYTDKRPEPSYKVKSAVSDVFDDGDVATDAEILYFYAPELCQSIWHESQAYVCTIGGHRFFEEAAK